MLPNFTKKIRYKLKFFPSLIIYEGLKYTKIQQSSILKELYLTGFYENELIKFFDFFEYDFFWDIGANIGFFSFYVSKKKKWDVEAYEPYKLNCDYMKELMVLNNINFNLNSLAVSDSTKEKKFYVPTKKSSSLLSSSATLNYSENEQYLKSKSFLTKYVKTVSFSNLLKKINLKKKYLIKVDIEGEEFKVFKSVKGIIGKFRNVDFIVEFNIGSTFNKKLFEIFKINGYESYLLTNIGLVKEDRPLVLPRFNDTNFLKAGWRNHFFTKKKKNIIKTRNLKIFKDHI